MKQLIAQYLFTNPWIPMAAWAVVYTSDYYLTIISAAWATGNPTIKFDKGFELTPYFRDEVKRQKLFSPRFALALLFMFFLIWAVWEIARRMELGQGYFEFLLGMLFLQEAAVHVRHFRNLVMFYYVRKGMGVEGSVKYRMWLSLKVSAAELAGFALLYLALAVVAGSWFAVGGFVGCIVTANKHWRLATRDLDEQTLSGDGGAQQEDGGLTHS